MTGRTPQITDHGRSTSRHRCITLWPENSAWRKVIRIGCDAGRSLTATWIIKLCIVIIHESRGWWRWYGIPKQVRLMIVVEVAAPRYASCLAHGRRKHVVKVVIPRPDRWTVNWPHCCTPSLTHSLTHDDWKMVDSN